MGVGKTIEIAPWSGTLKCYSRVSGSSDSCSSNDIMIWMKGLAGTITCLDDDASSCVIDGEGTRNIMSIEGTYTNPRSMTSNPEKLIIRAVKFYNGQSTQFGGGGLRIYDGSAVELLLCIFAACVVKGNSPGGAISVLASSSLSIRGTAFKNNYASVGVGHDIFKVDKAQLTVKGVCPSSYRSMQGPSLSVQLGSKDSGGSAYYSWSCYFSCQAGFRNTKMDTFSSSCDPCPSGKYSTGKFLRRALAIHFPACCSPISSFLTRSLSITTTPSKKLERPTAPRAPWESMPARHNHNVQIVLLDVTAPQELQPATLAPEENHPPLLIPPASRAQQECILLRLALARCAPRGALTPMKLLIPHFTSHARSAAPEGTMLIQRPKRPSTCRAMLVQKVKRMNTETSS